MQSCFQKSAELDATLAVELIAAVGVNFAKKELSALRSRSTETKVLPCELKKRISLLFAREVLYGGRVHYDALVVS